MTRVKLHSTEIIYLGFAETVNPDARLGERQIVDRVVALKKVRINKKKFDYKPLFDYKYYNLLNITSIAYYMTNKEIGWFISEDKIHEVIPRTGLQEADIIGPEQAKVRIIKKQEPRPQSNIVSFEQAKSLNQQNPNVVSYDQPKVLKKSV